MQTIQIQARDLRVEDKLVTGTNKSVRVADIKECPGRWRTHIHVNKDQCYDGRSFVEIRQGYR